MEEIYWIWLTLINGIGPVGAHQLIKKYETAENIYNNWKYIGVSNEHNSREDLFTKAQKIFEECECRKINIITYNCNRYKSTWKECVDFPLVLYMKGVPQIIDEIGIGIVGPRRCTVSAKQKAIDIATNAVFDNKTVISGMAKGVDSYAHTAALKNDGNTLAVLGTGVDICYPKEHNKLYEAICEKGAVISELIPGTEPLRYNFPRRNRIIAGLSDMVYIIEAGEKSGTRTTAKAANKYGKLVVMK